MLSPEEWFDAIAIAGCYEELPLLIEETESELAAQRVHAVKTVGLIKCDDQLRVAIACELVAKFIGQIRFQCLKIVELAVNDRVYCAVGIVERLIPGSAQVVDGQSAVTKDYINATSAGTIH